MKKLTCQCGGVEIGVKLPDDLGKLMRCNCSICKRKSATMSMIGKDDLKIIKGNDLLKSYQYHTKVAKHYFCSNCGIYTHHNPRINPKLTCFNLGNSKSVIDRLWNLPLYMNSSLGFQVIPPFHEFRDS